MVICLLLIIVVDVIYRRSPQLAIRTGFFMVRCSSFSTDPGKVIDKGFEAEKHICIFETAFRSINEEI